MYNPASLPSATLETLQESFMSTDLRALVVFADPSLHRSRISRRVADAVATLPGVRVQDLYQLYPDFYIDVRRERELVKAAPLIVFVFQLGWFAMPALLKEWFDSVFKPAWAAHEPGPLAGKAAFAAVACAGAATDYRPGGLYGRPLDDFLAPLEQSVKACGMDWLAPHVFYGAESDNNAGGAAADAAGRHADALRALLARHAGLDPASGAADGAANGT
ncbi:MAG: NAD(P)H dehydrogenase [Lysobacteraceae bacterium]|nr:MAG: NAD(P)H dehydrogenase [Xanthomonadaceae bacterium]